MFGQNKKAASFQKRPFFEFANRISQIRDFNNYCLVAVAAALFARKFCA